MEKGEMTRNDFKNYVTEKLSLHSDSRFQKVLDQGEINYNDIVKVNEPPLQHPKTKRPTRLALFY